MLLSQSIKLMEKYGNCPECGNGRIGNGEGGLVVEENSFERWCKCGWSVLIDGEEFTEEESQ